MTDEREAARQRVRDARAAHHSARDELNSAIVAAYRAGVPQTEIAADSGFTRAWIRRLLTALGESVAPTTRR